MTHTAQVDIIHTRRHGKKTPLVYLTVRDWLNTVVWRRPIEKIAVMPTHLLAHLDSHLIANRKHGRVVHTHHTYHTGFADVPPAPDSDYLEHRREHRLDIQREAQLTREEIGQPPTTQFLYKWMRSNMPAYFIWRKPIPLPEDWDTEERSYAPTWRSA